MTAGIHNDFVTGPELPRSKQQKAERELLTRVSKKEGRKGGRMGGWAGRRGEGRRGGTVWAMEEGTGPERAGEEGAQKQKTYALNSDQKYTIINKVYEN